MEEKKLNMEDTFQIWWFIFWRTFLTALGVALILGLIIKVLGMSDAYGRLINTISIIIGILIQVFYVKSAVNREYKEFRLSAILKDNT